MKNRNYMESEDNNIENENNGIMSNKEIIDIFCEKFKNNPNYCIYGYKFNDMLKNHVTITSDILTTYRQLGVEGVTIDKPLLSNVNE